MKPYALTKLVCKSSQHLYLQQPEQQQLDRQKPIQQQKWMEHWWMPLKHGSKSSQWQVISSDPMAGVSKQALLDKGLALLWTREVELYELEQSGLYSKTLSQRNKPREISEGKSTCSCPLQHLHGGSQPSVTLLLDLMPSSYLPGTLVHTCMHAHVQVGKILTHSM